jgi:hypothetical protein
VQLHHEPADAFGVRAMSATSAAASRRSSRSRPGRSPARARPHPPAEPELAFLAEADVAELRVRQVLVLFDGYVAPLLKWLREEAQDEAE